MKIFEVIPIVKQKSPDLRRRKSQRLFLPFHTFEHHDESFSSKGEEVLQNGNAAFTGSPAFKHKKVYVRYSTASELTDKNNHCSIHT